MKKLLCFFLLFNCFAFSQQLPPEALDVAQVLDTLESGWQWSVTGNYANANNLPTNNGFLSNVELRVKQHWGVRFDTFLVGSPLVPTFIIGPQGFLSLAHLLKPTPQFDTSKFELFGHAGAGAGRAQSDASPFKLAFSLGGGLQFNPGGKFFLRPLDLSYVRSVRGPAQIIGNHFQFAAGLGFKWGGR